MKKAIIFLDFNETFDDIRPERGKVLSSALTRFSAHFGGNVEIVIITSADYGNPSFSIRDDLVATLAHFPSNLKQKFKWLIEHRCSKLTPIVADRDGVFFGQSIDLSSTGGSKKDGVEKFLAMQDPNDEVCTCVFAGDHEQGDLVMIDADVKAREKFFLLANKRVLKDQASHKLYTLSMQKQPQSFNFGKEIFDKVGETCDLIIKTGRKSYGVGRGLSALTSYLEVRDKNREK